MGAPREAVVHFSGGSDSTLAAALYAERFDKVHLLTYDRFSFIGARDYTAVNFERLAAVYGPERFERVVLPVGRWHKRLCYERYASFARRYGTAVTALAFCKLAMHWRSAVYALERGIGVVADGAVPYMRAYPDQNSSIALESLRRFYAGFGIRYENPVYERSEGVERTLYDRGITDLPEVRGTGEDFQVFYVEQVVFALFLKYYVGRHGEEGYESALRGLFAEKLDMMAETVRAWRAAPAGSLVEALAR